jgi:hypothetical protein
MWHFMIHKQTDMLITESCIVNLITFSGGRISLSPVFFFSEASTENLGSETRGVLDGLKRRERNSQKSEISTPFNCEE